MRQSATPVDLSGRVALVTGANTGIGRVTAETLARWGATVWLACRSKAKADPVIAAITAEHGPDAARFLPLDLGDLDSVRACAAQFLETDGPLHLLINNAGLAGQRGQTASGFELAFGVNHVGHFLLTHLLLDRLEASAPARIINVASIAHQKATGIDYAVLRQPTKAITGLPEYQVSKLANVMFTAELARRLEGTGVVTHSLHPGVVASDIWRKVPGPIRWLMKRSMITNEQGAQTTLHCATAPEAGETSGLYWDDCRVVDMNPAAQDAAAAAELWSRSREWTGL